MQVHASGYYAWKVAPQSPRALDDLRLLGLLKQACLERGGVYGHRKLTLDMRDLGERCGKHRVARLPKGDGRRPGMRGGNPAAVATNYLQREFTVAEANRSSVTDISLYLGGVANSVRRTRRGQHGHYVRPQAWDVDVAPRLTFAPIRDRTVAKASPCAMSLH